MGVSMMNKSGMFGGTGKGGVSFLDKSQTSSPTKFGSPMRRAFTGAESMTDAQSTMTGGMSRGSPMKGAEANLMSLLNNQVGGIQALLEREGFVGGKNGLTMGNKDFMKLNKAGGMGGGAMSQTGSRKTGRTGVTGFSKSKKSAVMDFEEMEIEEVESLIQSDEAQIKTLEQAVKKINKNKLLNDGQRKKDLQPLEEEMSNIRKRIVVYLKIIDFKTPYYMKLPKDHQFFKHHMQNLKLNRMKDAAKNKVLENKDLF